MVVSDWSKIASELYKLLQQVSELINLKAMIIEHK